MESTAKRILIFSTAYYPFVGGAEVAIKEITDRLPADFEFDLITAKLEKNLPKYEKIGRVNIFRIGFGNPLLDKLLLPLRGALLAGKLNKKNNYACMWGMMVTFGSGGGYLLNFGRVLVGKKRIPMVLTLQEGDSENHLQYRWAGLISLSWKLALRQTDVLTAISNFLLKRAKKNGFSGEGLLIPNGVDLEIFSKEIESNKIEEIKTQLDKKEGDIFLVTVGRLTYKNAVDDIISALPKLSSNIHLVIIGKGNEGSYLQKQANDLGVSNRVKFLGFIPYNDIPNYFSVSDIFIRPSRSEGFGNSFIEAMAFGLPVIATPVGGITDFIDDRETGVFCSPDNPQSIAKTVEMLIKDSSLKNLIVLKAKERVKDRYSWDYVSTLMQTLVFDRFSIKV